MPHYSGWDVGCMTMSLGEAATLTVRGDKVCGRVGESELLKEMLK